MMQKRRNAPVTLALIVINAICFFLISSKTPALQQNNMIRLGAMYAPLIFREKEYWRLLSAAFLHFDIHHLANNMFVLFVFGDNLERALGRGKYLFLYVGCAVFGNAFSLYYHMNDMHPIVGAGASGAVYGVIGGLLWVLIRNRGRFEDLSSRRVFLFAILSLYYGFTSQGVDNAAHVGGLLVGFIVSVLFYRKKPREVLGL